MSRKLKTWRGTVPRWLAVWGVCALAACAAGPSMAPMETQGRAEEMMAPAPVAAMQEAMLPALPMLPGMVLDDMAMAGEIALEAVPAQAMAMDREARIEEERAEKRGVAWGLDLDDGLPDEAMRGARRRPAAVPEKVYAPVRQFPVPDYSVPYRGPRVDFRETVYWHPSVRTNAQGEAQVSFYLSDGVTSFRASAEGVATGGRLVQGETVIASKLPVSLAVRLPLEVTRGDVVEIPIVLANDSTQAQKANFGATLGPAFRVVAHEVPEEVNIGAGERLSYFIRAEVVGDGSVAAHGEVRVAVQAGAFADFVQRTISVVPEGFPFAESFSGRLTPQGISHVVSLDRPLPGTTQGVLRFYPSAVSSLVSGTEAMVREPYGCFEQASSSTYPNIMIMDYLSQGEEADVEVLQRTAGYLDRGYALLTGYESPTQGYEWFGGDPGHEALTAYGLMEFVDMQKVHEVDSEMIARTANWLMSRRDGQGGYLRNPRALDSFGRASDEVTNSYITYALTEAGFTDIPKEIAYIESLAGRSEDPYVLALAANVLVNVAPGSALTERTMKKLVAKQGSDGAFLGADHSVTRSGGGALAVETTALAALALMKYAEQSTPAIEAAIGFIASNNDGWGGFYATQSTVLGLKALTTFMKRSARLPAGSVAVISVDGKEVARQSFTGEESGEVTLDSLGAHFTGGRHEVSLRLEVPGGGDGAQLNYSLLVAYRTGDPQSSKEAAVQVSTRLLRPEVPLGETVRMEVEVENRRDAGVPMALARVGLPGGLSFQTWQLKELVERGVIDFYETQAREVVLYFRSMPPLDKRQIQLDLMAIMPGSYKGTPSAAYLYYTNEHRHWAAPVAITVSR